MIRAWRKRRRCPHVHLNGIYGDAALHLDARLECLDCRALLEGPVKLAEWRKAEAGKLAAWWRDLPYNDDRESHDVRIPRGSE